MSAPKPSTSTPSPVEQLAAQRFTALTETRSLLVVALDKRSRIKLFSKGCEALTGYTQQELARKSFITNLIAPEQHKGLRQELQTLVAARSSSQYVSEVVLKSGERRTIEWTFIPIIDEDEKLREIIGFGQDLTEEGYTEAIYQAVIEDSPQGIILIQDGGVVFANSVAAELSGYSIKEITTKSPMEVLEMMHPDDQERYLQGLQDRLAGKPTPSRVEYRFLHKDGSERWVQGFPSTIQYRGKPAIQVSLIDITERKEAEAALRNSEAKYRAVVEGAPFSIVIHQKGQMVYVKEDTAKLYGYSLEEFRSLTSEQFIGLLHTEDQSAAIQRSKDRAAGKPIQKHYQYRMIRKDGILRWLEIWHSEIEYQGAPAIQFVIMDITERKEVEAALRESEARYRSLFDSVPIALYRTTPEGQIIDTNPAMVEMLGYPDRDTLLTVNAADLYTEKTVREQWERELREKGVLRDFEVQLSRFDGQYLWVVNNSRVIRDSEGTALYYEGALQDVTQRKEVTEAYRQIVDASPVGLVILKDSHIVFSNQLFCDIIGYSREELLAMTTEELYITVFKDDLEAVLNRARERLAGATSLPPIQFRARHKDGTTRWVEGTSRRIEYQGKPALQVALIDITERKAAGEAMIESETKYRTLFETMAQGVVYQNNTGEITSANPAAERILGLTLDQMQGRTSVDPRWRTIHEDGSDFPGEAHPAMVALQTGEKVHDVVMGVYNPVEETTRWIKVNAVPQFRDGESTPYQVYTTFDDITERKQAEKALQESERKYRSFVENFPGIAYRADVEGIPVFFQGAVEEITGYTEEDFVSGRVPWMAICHPEDWSGMEESWKRIGTMPGTAVEREYRITHREGYSRWVYERIRNISDETGKVVQVEGVLLDVTERKQIDLALKRERDRAQQYLDVAGVILVALDPHENVVLINRKGCELLGVSEKDALGKNWFDTFVPERFRKDVKQMYIQLMKGETEPVEYFENPILTSKGEERLIAWRNVIFRDEEGNILGSLSSGEDITERRQMEQALLDSEERLRSVTENAPDQIILLDQQFRILFINRILEDLTMGEVLGKSVLDFISPDFQETASDCYKRVWVTGKPETFYTESPQENGEVQVFEVRVSPILESDRVVALVSNSTDITTRRETEKQLRESEAKYRSFVENFLGIAYRSRPDYIIEFFHGAVQAITGYSEDDFVSGRVRWDSVIHPDDFTRLERDFDRMGSTPGAIGELEYRIIRKDGSIRWLHDNMRGLYSPDYHVTAIEGVLIDITERKEAEEDAFEAQARAEFFNDLMVHDLTNIHQAILSLLELVLLDTALPNQAREFVQTALAQLVRSSDLISKVKKFALIDTSPRTMEHRDISEPLFAAADAIRDSYPQRRLDIHTGIAPGKYYAQVDEFVYDMFFNLLHNAMRYDRREEVRIDILVDQEEEFLKLQIQDRGPGIADGDKAQIFARLTSRERGERGVRGRGIGLTLVQRIVTRYEGKIWVEDRVPDDHSQGASFVVLLPRGDVR
jgi:PAS domain S-box-containing protein